MELTSARFFAAMAVLLGHFSDLLALPPVVSQLISGGIGVSFFFVLSGFILTYRYWDSFSVSVNAQSFFREGRKEQWKKILTPEQVRTIEGQHAEQMRRFGYL
jgi:hypothetical protein